MTTIEVGPGGRRCTELERLVRDGFAVEGVPANGRCLSDPTAIVARGFVMRTPGLVTDGRVIATGRVRGRREIDWLAHTALRSAR